MARTPKRVLALLLAVTAAALSDGALALQFIDAGDGMTVEGIASIKDPTRIRIDGAPIVNVFGNIYSSSCSPQAPQSGTAPAQAQVNSAGEFVLECDSDRGEVYIRPVGTSSKPVTLFVASQRATYTLVLRRSDTPADTIVIRDRTLRAAAAANAGSGSAERASTHVRSIKAMLLAMESDRVPADIRVEELDRPVQLWVEAKFSLMRVYEGRGFIGERYLLTNVSNADMVLAEQEFDREGAGVLGVAIDNHNLRPGDSTGVYVIRQGR
jgi:conjugal transfer pilus assembly protein TraK